MRRGAGSSKAEPVFVTFEGIEGSGKSTQIEALREHVVSAGHHCDVTREPGGTPIAEAIRGVLLDPENAALSDEAELLLYIAARAQHVAERIRPALATGTVVLCDRFTHSTLAYQGAARGIDRATIDLLNRFATVGLVPDVCFLLDLPAKTGLERALDGRTADRIEAESLEFHEAVRGEFLALARSESETIIVLDATQPADEIAKQIAIEFDTRFAKRSELTEG